jgi:hypothetical protein
VYFNTTTKELTYGPYPGLYAITTVSSSTYTVLATDSLLNVTNGSATTITLPTANSSVLGKTLIIKDTLGATRSGNSITINANAGQQIDGSASVSITVGYNSITLVCVTSTTWNVV